MRLIPKIVPERVKGGLDEGKWKFRSCALASRLAAEL